jgi:hypothetical protein
MHALRSIIDTAVGEALAEHPKYFTPKGAEHARGMIVRKIMAAFRDDPKAEKVAEVKIEAAPVALRIETTSREARGFTNLLKIAGAVAPFEHNGTIYIPAEAACEAVYALADLPERHEWIFVTATNQISAWMLFFAEKLGIIARRSIMEQPFGQGQEGILMPYPWPPSKTGKVYEAAEAGI